MPALTRKILKYCEVTLASSSPRRAALLRKIPWLRVTVFPSRVVESAYAGGDPADYAMTLARRKAEDVWRHAGGLVIGADTVVALDGEVLGKPVSGATAERMLCKLCGRTHTVITGYCVASDAKIVQNCVKTRVTFGDYLPDVVHAYIGTGAPFDKAGGYGLQDEMIAPLIQSVEGDRDNVIGLPIEALRKTLEEFL